MKITKEKMTIEANAEELRQSNGLADSFTQLLRGCLNGTVYQEEEDEIDFVAEHPKKDMSKS